MSIVLLGSTSGSCTLQEQAVAGTSVLTLPVGTGTVVANNVNSAIVSGTAVASTSGTSIDFTSIPSWAKRITVMFNGVSTNGTSNYQVQLGATTFTTSGYLGSSVASSGGTGTFSSGFVVFQSPGTSSTLFGPLFLTLLTGNTWVAAVCTSRGDVAQSMTGAGSVALSGTLDRVRITTVNGTDTFDAGTINILYE